MTPDSESNLRLEIGHVLFIDLVGYSKLLIEEQKAQLSKLTEIVLATTQVAESNDEQLVRLPTGDGMALVFRNSAEEPAQCALEITQALNTHPDVAVRMGIHSGPVSEVKDVSGRTNITGGGINMAQRVMDCGDAGHILLSKHVANDLQEHRQWSSWLHDLGECEVKHGVRLGIVNLYRDGVGNPQLPRKLRALKKRKARMRWAATTAALLAIAAALFVISKKPAGSTAAIPEKSIAVLPFENLSAEKDDAFFADGIQDDVLASLGKIKDLKVIGRASVMIYRGAAMAGKLREIGQSLQVSHLLQGSVRRSATRVVINVALIDARNDSQVWSQRYDRTLSDSLSLQGEVATEIARELRATLTPAEQNAANKKPTENAEAYVLYLRGRENENRFYAKQPEFDAAEKFYQQAVNLDPKFALAHARLSMMISRNHRAEAKIKAREEADYALRLQPELGEGRLALAYYFQRCESDFDQALHELGQAAALLPNSSEVARAMGQIHRSQRKWREALNDFERAAQLDPDNTQLLHYDLALTYRTVRNWPAALRARTRLKAALEKQNMPMIADTGATIDEFYATSSLVPFRNLLTLMPADKDVDPNDVNVVRYDLAMMERNYGIAEEALAKVPAEFLTRIELPSKLEMQALLQFARRDSPARIAATLAPELKSAQDDIEKSANAFENHLRLGVLLAFVGKKEDAIREGLSGAELANAREKDYALASLALIYALANNAEEAVNLIEALLTRPGPIDGGAFESMTVADLRLRPQWDSLRSNRRFKKLIEGPEPKTVY